MNWFGKPPQLSFRWSRPVGVATLLAGASLVLAGCDDAEPQFGVTLATDGRLEIVHNPCRDNTRVHGVYIEPKGITEPLWHIASDEGSQQRRFKIGERPAGFREVTPLVASLPELIVIAISTEPDGRFQGTVDAESVRIADIRAGTVLVPRRGEMTSEEFQESSTCD